MQWVSENANNGTEKGEKTTESPQHHYGDGGLALTRLSSACLRKSMADAGGVRRQTARLTRGLERLVCE